MKIHHNKQEEDEKKCKHLYKNIMTCTMLFVYSSPISKISNIIKDSGNRCAKSNGYNYLSSNSCLNFAKSKIHHSHH